MCLEIVPENGAPRQIVNRPLMRQITLKSGGTRTPGKMSHTELLKTKGLGWRMRCNVSPDSCGVGGILDLLPSPIQVNLLNLTP